MNDSKLSGKYCVSILVFLLLAGQSLPALGENLTALVIEAAGKVGYRQTGSSGLLPVQVNLTRLTQGDALITAPNSKATLLIEGKTVPGVSGDPERTTIEVGPKTRLLMSTLFADAGSGDESIQVGVAEGEVISNVRRINTSSERFEIDTPTAIAAVRGTKFLTSVSKEGGKFKVAFKVSKGRISITDRLGKRLAAIGEGEGADIDPSGGVSISQTSSSGGSSGGPSLGGPGGGRGRGVSPLGGPASSGESGDTMNAPMQDGENDDIGSRE
jgi:hypothetical protein